MVGNLFFSLYLIFIILFFFFKYFFLYGSKNNHMFVIFCLEICFRLLKIIDLSFCQFDI